MPERGVIRKIEHLAGTNLSRSLSQVEPTRMAFIKPSVVKVKTLSSTALWHQ